MSADSLMAKYFEAVPEAPHSPGFTYFLMMPDGLVKIGYATKLYKRLRNLHRESNGRLTVLAVVEGGFSMESLMHNKFKDLRLKYQFGERFNPTAELLDYAEAIGIHPSAMEDVCKYYSTAAKWEQAAA